PNFDAGPAMALGTMQASVLDMTQAYATLADHGRRTPYTLVEKIEKGDGDVHLPDRTPRQAVSREAADTTTSMLVSVVDNGTGTAALAAGHPAAGKTGTAELDRSAWFAAYTPDLVTVVSMMGQDPDTGALESLYGALGEARIGGGGYPARIWAQYTKAALENSDPLDFDLDLQPGAAPSPPPFVPSSPEPPQDESTPQSPAPPSRPNRPGRPTPPTGGQDQGGRSQGQNQGQNQGQTTGGQTPDGDTTGGQSDAGTSAGTSAGTTAGTTTGSSAGALGGVTGGLRSRPSSQYLE
ncbi:penicillin-binding transpeptidase domain-containing protein, partial [Streptomyces roseus]|uniref:penicillin-binding transpeptidase domain-containing protein n=1 Tax=Streptomyces roseus TaxID=66430 RepID=UPI0033E72C60